VEGAWQRANYFNRFFYENATSIAHVLNPVITARKFAVLHMWKELAVGDGNHVGKRTPHSWERGQGKKSMLASARVLVLMNTPHLFSSADCTHFCNPSGPLLMMVRLLQTALLQMTQPHLTQDQE
jgi:hypothetical protein